MNAKRHAPDGPVAAPPRRTFETAHFMPRGSLRSRVGDDLVAVVHGGGVTLSDEASGEEGATVEIPNGDLDAVIAALTGARDAARRIAGERRAAAAIGRALACWGGARPAGTETPANDHGADRPRADGR